MALAERRDERRRLGENYEPRGQTTNVRNSGTGGHTRSIEVWPYHAIDVKLARRFGVPGRGQLTARFTWSNLRF